MVVRVLRSELTAVVELLVPYFAAAVVLVPSVLSLSDIVVG